MPAAIIRAALIGALAGSAMSLGGCASRLANFTNSITESGSIAPGAPANSTTPGGPGAARPGRETGALAELAKRYDAKPGTKPASLAYAEALRASGQHQQAVAVLQRASVANIGDRDIAAAYGKALADVGRLQEANSVLALAHSDDRPNAKVLSTMGSISDQLGEHERARELYHQALQIAPNDAFIHNNLGLSYVLTKDLTRAEASLRHAAALPGADDRIRANLALALQLQGRRPDSPPAPAIPAAAASPAPLAAPAATSPFVDAPKPGRGFFRQLFATAPADGDAAPAPAAAPPTN